MDTTADPLDVNDRPYASDPDAQAFGHNASVSSSTEHEGSLPPSPLASEESNPEQLVYQWDGCNKQMKRTKRDVMRHMRKAHCPTSYAADIVSCRWARCKDKISLKNQAFPRHMDIHIGFVVQCPRCLKVLSRPDALERHLNMRKPCVRISAQS